MARWGAERGCLRHLTHLPTTTAGGGTASRAVTGRRPGGDPRGVREGEKMRGNLEARTTPAELGVGNGQRLGRLEVTQIWAQNDRNPEALATCGRK